MKMRINGKRVLIYAFMLLVSVLHFWMDAGYGFPLLLAFLAVPMISLILSGISCKKTTMEITVSHEAAYKGEQVRVSLTIHNKSRLPIPFYEAGIYADGNLTPIAPDETTKTLTIPSKGTMTLTAHYTADIWGTPQVSACEAAITDMIGLFSTEPHSPTCKACLNIFPALCESETNELAAEILQASAYQDEIPQQTNIAYSLVSEPGYEHRSYEPGDPLKQMNWKLSAKRNEWLIRYPEYPAENTLLMVLDPYDPTTTPNTQQLKKQERMVEAFLAMLLCMHRLRRNCEAYCMFAQEWRMFTIESMEDITALQMELAVFCFSAQAASRIPPGLLAGGSPVTVFTCCPDPSLIKIMVDMDIVCAEPDGPVPDGRIWMVDKNYDFYKY